MSKCGPIKADSLLTTCLESALENGTFEMSGTSVSLGLKVSNKKKGRPSPTQEHEDEPNRKSESGGDFLRLSMHGDPLAHENTVLLSDASTQFLQLNGKSSIGVDEEGVFISIPTHKPVVKDATGKDSFTGKLQTSQRGLRIPSSVDLRVECVQPLSVVLTVPLMQQVVEESPQQVDNEVKTDPNGTEGDSHGEDEKMKKFLNSSILAIPWAYVGWHSPEAYATVENEAKLSEAQKAQLVQQAEEDALNFANTVCSLAEFISSLPEGTKELRICFSCDDRLERDALAMSIRALCCRPSGSTKLQRQAAFPWYQRAAMENAENETHSLIADSNETEIEMKRRVRTLQEENNSLRREKNELTSQLLEQREEMISLRAITVVNSNGIDLSSLDKSQDNDPAEAHKEGEDLSVDKYKEILGTVIELENKLQIQQKKEVSTLYLQALHS